ncbi:MAG: tripartite tricarboxylate transporter TctB family protein [Thermodesulfobacteriota bacterium]
MRKSGNVIVGLCFLAIGGVFAAGSVGLKIGVPTEPKAGFFPFIDGVILSGLAVLFLYQTWRGRAGDSPTFGRVGGPAVVVLTLILYTATLETLGYVVTTAVLAAVVLRVMDTKPAILVPVSLILAVVSYLLFDRLLGVTLPPGLTAAFL